MTLQGYLGLAAQSVTAPREVARLLLSQHFPREVLLTAFALVCVLNTMLYCVSLLLPIGAGNAPLVIAPAAFLVLQALTLAGTIGALTLAGRMLGGRAEIPQVALLMIWMQGLRVLVQAAFVLVAPVVPAMGSLLILGATALGVWIAVNFLDEAHGFDTLLRALMTLILGVLGMAIALSVLLTLLGVVPNGTLLHV